LWRVHVTIFATQTQKCPPYLLFRLTCICQKHNTVEFCHENARIVPLAMLSSHKIFPTAVNINLFLILNFRLILNVVFFLLGDSAASEFYMPAFRNTLSVPSSLAISAAYTACEDGTDSIPKPRHIKFRRQGITQKKEYNIKLLRYSRKGHEILADSTKIFPLYFRQNFPT